MHIERLHHILDELHSDSSEIKASAIVAVDGLMLASALSQGINEDRIGAMSAALLSLGDRVVEDLKGEHTDRIMIQSKVGYIIISQVSKELLLTVVARPDAKLGMVFHDIKKASQEILTSING